MNKYVKYSLFSFLLCALAIDLGFNVLKLSAAMADHYRQQGAQILAGAASEEFQKKGSLTLQTVDGKKVVLAPVGEKQEAKK